MTIVCEYMQIVLYALSNFLLNSCSNELNSLEDLLIHDILIMYIAYVQEGFCKCFKTQFGKSKWKVKKYKCYVYIRGLKININASMSQR